MKELICHGEKFQFDDADYGSWISLSGSLSGAGITTTADAVLDFVVTCTGATGWINISDFTFA